VKLPLTPRPDAEFKRILKRPHQRGKDMEKLRALIDTLADHSQLDSRHMDHALSRDWKGWRATPGKAVDDRRGSWEEWKCPK
jgi:mRNA-degrading endonuclease YafQ of YafQ-DinJ toxin-antitoxin module